MAGTLASACDLAVDQNVSDRRAQTREAMWLDRKNLAASNAGGKDEPGNERWLTGPKA